MAYSAMVTLLSRRHPEAPEGLQWPQSHYLGRVDLQEAGPAGGKTMIEAGKETIHHRICPFCEACCGLEITVAEGRVKRIRGHAADVFSRGYLCPKGVALKDLHEDPDRLRQPLIKREWPLCGSDMGRSFRRDRTPFAADHRQAWGRFGRFDLGKSNRPQTCVAALCAAPGPRVGIEECFFRVNAGPDAQASFLRADVRRFSLYSCAGH